MEKISYYIIYSLLLKRTSPLLGDGVTIVGVSVLCALRLTPVSSCRTQQIYGYEDLHMLQSRLPMVSQ